MLLVRPLLALLCIAIASCASLPPKELALVRERGVPTRVLMKIESNEPLTPPEVIGLTHRGVPDRIVIRHIQSAGMDYLITRDDVIQLRRAGVSAAVVDAMLAECDRFARRYSSPPAANYDAWWSDSVFIAPALYFSW